MLSLKTKKIEKEDWFWEKENRKGKIKTYARWFQVKLLSHIDYIIFKNIFKISKIVMPIKIVMSICFLPEFKSQ